ncbi:tyrosine recombinase XerC [Parachlamydia sp. AcF125]|uniref:tyrosine recombinase XerC n=1 Tax=Parachlamydia sp. AcF125 TaxID=2795736 RepID=UPI001BC9CAF0|nr:Tyrosine recombinase XerD [Parachlamydia sp. AcF125]
MFIEAAYRFLEYLRIVKNASEHTVRNYAIDLNALKEYLEHDFLPEGEQQLPPKIRYNEAYSERLKMYDSLLKLEAISRKTIRGFLAYLSEHQVHKRTVVRRLSSLRSFFKYTLTQKWISTNPTEELESPRVEKKVPNSLSYDQVQALFDQPDVKTLLGFRDRVIMELFYSSGLRVSELVALDRHEFDPKNLLIKLKGKGKKERIIPITKNAADWISAYLTHPERCVETDGHLAQQDPDAIFLNRLGTRLTTRSVDRKFDKYLTASGLIGKVTPHTIRHTIATHWLENGMDLKTIQMILGHTSLATTTIYTQVSKSLKKKVYDQTHPRA